MVSIFRQNGQFRIIGAISRDLNGIPAERRRDDVDSEAQIHVSDIGKEFCSNSTIHGVRY